MTDGKRKVRFNWVDLAILLVIALIILVTVWAFHQAGRSETAPSTEKVTIRYVVKVSELREELADSVVAGDIAYDGSGMHVMGRVTGRQTDDATWFSQTVTREVTGADGKTYREMVSSPIPGKVDLYVTFESEGYLGTDGRYYIDGVLVGTGVQLHLMTQHFWCEGYVVSVSAAGE